MKSNKKILIVFSLLVVVFGMTSCLRDKSIVGPDADGALKNLIEFKNTSAITSTPTAPYPVYVPQTLDPEVDQITINAVVRYAGVDNAPNDITVNLGTDAAVITAYNTAVSGSALVQMPSSSYTMPSSVTIKRGEREAVVPIVVKVSALDQSISNALVLKINSVSTSDVISGNFGTVIYSLPIKSLWEGEYTYTILNDFGTIDGNIGGTFTEEKIRLTTVGPNLVQMTNLWQTYSGYSQYQFSGDNSTITKVVAFSGSVLASSINEVISVNETTKSFKIKWTGLNRGVTETFTRTGD